MARYALVGATFAVDEALARPLAALTQQAARDRSPIVIDWLGYGDAADLSTLQGTLQRARVDIIVLLVRLSDLRAAHPELCVQRAPHQVGEQDLLVQLREYDRRADSSSPHLVVQFCPSPPADSELTLVAEEDALRAQIRVLDRVSCCDSLDLLRFFGDGCDWYDAMADKRAHAPFTQAMLDVVALCCTRQICRLFLRAPKKVIVLDCDNTIWGGSVADLGPDGVELSERFLALQRFALDQQRRGLLLCLCSKNIPEDVDAVFTRRATEMVLQKNEHIVLSKVNWLPKSQNVRELAQELSLGLDSFVFVDDNAIECDEVLRVLPTVSVVQVPDDFDLHFLKAQWVFDSPLGSKMTGEDSERTKMYQQNAMRTELQRQTPTQAAFLSSLGIRILCERVQDASSSAFDRILQSHQRTNTFNVATSFSRSVTRESLEAYVRTHFALASTVTDRYGHYGLVCVALFRIVGENVIVDSFLMSCRSINRGVEHAMVKLIAETADENGSNDIYVSWEPTVRNEPARTFFATLSMSKFVSSVGDFGAVLTRDEKISSSASTSGFWKLSTRNARGISFLKECAEPIQESSVITWPRRAFAFLAGLLTPVVRKWLPWLPLFRLLSRIFGRRNVLTRAGDRDLLATHVYRREHLGKLLRACLAVRENDHETTVVVSREKDESDEAFRLRARYHTKLQLLDHVSADAPRVVWAPHRDDDIRLDVEEPTVDQSISMATMELQHFHRPCATPSCSKTVFWESECSFQRCRTCCYRVQRLLTRATSEVSNRRARDYATQSLANDFNLEINQTTRRGEWCTAHTNDKKRRGADSS